MGQPNLPEEWAQLAAGKGLGSARAIADAAGVAHQTVRRLIYHVGNPDDETVGKLARALGVPERRILELAGRPGDLGAYAPPSEARRLTAKQREVVNSVIRALLDVQPAAAAQELPSLDARRTEKQVTARQPRRQAARKRPKDQPEL